MLENKDIGFVRPGQEVEVKVETFTFTKYGVVHGTVLTVSNDAVEDEKRGLLYSTRIQLHENSVLVGGSRVALTPGMAVRAEVRTQTRKIIEYFTSPFKESIEESLKERWVMISSELRENSNRKRFKALALWIPISYLILSISPFAYEMLNQIPDNLIESKGILSTKKIGKDIYTVISNEQSEQVLTCASSFKGYTKCLPDKISPELINKEATAFWYKQKILPLTTSNRLVELHIDGNAVVSGEMTKERMIKSKKSSIYTHLEIFALALLISAFFLKKARES